MRISHVTSVLFVALSICVCPSYSSRAGDLRFRRHVINAETDYSAAALIDVNHDGRPDIVCGGDWYEAPHWKRHFLAEIPRIGGRPDGFAHLPLDVNRDGWTDVITVNYRSRSIKWIEHPGASLGPWTTHVAVEPGPMETGRLVDIDRDGQLDLLPNGANFAAWWELRWKSGSGPAEPAWIRHDLPSEAGGHGLGFGDINGDGRGDIVGQNGWLEAPGDVRHGRWHWHADFRLERASIPMLVVDADEDGDNDIVWCSAHGFGVYWLEQIGGTSGPHRWSRHAIDTSWSQGHSPLWHDMDGDGRAELITGKRYMAHGGMDPGEYDPIAIYRYQFHPRTRTWDRWTVSEFGQRVGMGLDPKIADIDGDGDPDLLASGRSGLYWLENLRADPPSNSDANPTSSAVPTYEDHEPLLAVKSDRGVMTQVDEPEAWGVRRWHIIAAIENTHGALPNSSARVPLHVKITREIAGNAYRTHHIEYHLSAERRASAQLLLPTSGALGNTAALVCMFGPSDGQLATQIAGELAAQGFACVVPELVATEGREEMMDAVWQAMRAADVLQASPLVHGERIGFVGNALEGQLGLYVAAMDQRFLATVTDTSRASRLAALEQSHYSLSELLACVAPRWLRVATPTSNELATALQDATTASRPVFELRRVRDNLQLSPDSFQKGTRQRAATWELLKERFRPRSPFSRRGP